MSHVLTALLLYAAVVAQVALRYGGAAGWTPNLLLLVGFASAGRVRGGIIWAAVAGLLCDGIGGRPLGVTMLVATLAVAVSRGSRATSARPRVWRAAVGVFLSVAAVEAASRVLAVTVMADPSYAAELLAAARVAATTACVSVAGATIRRGMPRFVNRNAASSAEGRFRPRAAHR